MNYRCKLEGREEVDAIRENDHQISCPLNVSLLSFYQEVMMIMMIKSMFS